MLSVASLLNPVSSKPSSALSSSPTPPPPRAPLPYSGTRFPSPSTTSSSTHGSPQFSLSQVPKKAKMTKDGAVFTKGKIKGEVNYPPFERLDEAMMREVQKFQVYPLGKIQDYCRHIPYNSEKKSFLERTGRESFEVFQYIFKVPGDEKEYCVMWDYNIGLVRITPFFKCCKYSKTTPAKMLNMNPGLKEITHSITGGALAAQGYWMPYTCALSICTTFASHIAPALIPIFGPQFPSLCVSPDAPEHGRMIIDPQIIIDATNQAESYRVQYSSQGGGGGGGGGGGQSSRESSVHAYSPQIVGGRERLGERGLGLTGGGRSLRLKRVFGGESPYTTTSGAGTGTTDTDPETSSSETPSSSAYFGSNSPSSSSLSRHPHHGWQAHNFSSHAQNSAINVSSNPGPMFKGPNPILSAIPRSSGILGMGMHHQQQHISYARDSHAASHHSGGNSLGANRWPINGLGVTLPRNYLPHPTSNSISNSSHTQSQAETSKRQSITKSGKRPRGMDTPHDDDREYDGDGSVTGASEKEGASVDGGKSSPGSEKDAAEGERDDVAVSVSTAGHRDDGSGRNGGGEGAQGKEEKKAAWLLMKLSVKDGERTGGNGDRERERGRGEQEEEEGPRVKRRRALSM